MQPAPVHVSPGDACRAMGLLPTRRCPVCGGAEREPAQAMSQGGQQYLRHVAARLGMPVEQLIERAHVFRCVSCGSYYCDPWLSPELASWLFAAGSPDHNAGWTELETWVRDLGGRLQRRNQRLYAAVTRRTGPLRRYAEFGCPFQGFLLQMKACEADPAARRRLFARALRRPSDVRWSRLTRIYNALEGLSRGFFLLALRTRILLDGATSRRHTPTAPDDVPRPPERRYLLTQDTTTGWGSNCVRYGASCRFFAREMLDADVIPMDQAHRTEGVAFDLIGVFNSLDHTTYPADVLRKLLDMANHVLVVGHDARYAGKQHLYAFGDDFAAWLGGAFAASVEDLRDEVDLEGVRDYHYLLLTRRSAAHAAARS